MTIIDGIGDEVTHFFITIAVLLIIAIAWATTDIRQQWNIRTVYLLERSRVRRSRTQRLSNHMESTTISEGRDPLEGTSSIETVSSHPSNVQETPERNKPPENNDSVQRSTEVDEQEEIVEMMDSELDSLPNRRVAYFEDSEFILEQRTTNTGSSTDGNNTNSTLENTPVSTVEGPNENIKIKLKYINDDLKVVDGSLEELLGDFKRRHFHTEFTSNKMVRLIFNGQVLQRDSDTLRTCGMFNNCVVHCLVHQLRQFESENGESRSSSSNNNQREWDLGNLLIASISFSLGSAWYFRYQYPQLFTVTATIGLVAITGIFTVISVGIYFPDYGQPRQRPQEQT